jgi:TPR repeat protein
MFLWLSAALAATLPGLPDVPLDPGVDGGLVLADPLPQPLLDAGLEPGWVLEAVDDLVTDDVQALEAMVARGPARDLRLRIKPPKQPAAIVVARRGSLVVAEQRVHLDWPEGFVMPARDLVVVDGQVGVTDADQVPWRLDAASRALVKGVAAGEPARLPALYWELTTAPWATVRPDQVQWGDTAWARGQFADAARVGRWGDEVGDHLVVLDGNGLQIVSLSYPSGTPMLPSCRADVPETCLTSARQILGELGDRQGAEAEAVRQLDVACGAGVHRACFEADAVQYDEVAERAGRCVESLEVGDCVAVARERRDLFEVDDVPSDRLVGELELACEAEATGTLGQRLRRLEQVGEGCAMLAEAYDARQAPDLALLSLDRACVVGRAEACTEAQERRDAAFAARTVRECEDEELPIAPSCVELGRLQQEGEVGSATLDAFGAFLRACTLGATEGCIALGDYVDRWGIGNQRVVDAEAELQASCDDGELRACLGAGHLLVRHEPRSEAYGQALMLFDRACDGRIADACVAGAEQRRIGMAKKVAAPTQLALWEAACQLNAPVGCAGLGERQWRERGGLGDAFASYTRACDLGDAASCSTLGPLVEEKHEPAFDGEQPPEVYLGRGCDNGDAQGCYWLAERRIQPDTPPDESAYLLLERSCEGEHGDGCAALAQVHLDRGTNFDDEIAAEHLLTACDNGTYDSCKTLGQMYLRGKGVERDRQKANELLERFRLNAERKHVRLGVAVGLPVGVGGEAELVVPIPVGPALSVWGQGSYLPGAGALLLTLRGREVAEGEDAELMVLGGGARLYPNTQARGLYVGGGVHQITTSAQRNGYPLDRFGWTGNVGYRLDSKLTYTSLEIGLGQYGVLDPKDWGADPGTTTFPLLVPTVGFSMGLAVL